jgi:bifunctional DNase/RNase
MWVEMKVKQLALDSTSNLPVLILSDHQEKRSFPIWVGLAEANAIAYELEKIPTQRPMTHDLIKALLEALKARVLRVVVNDLRDNTFFALIHLQLNGEEITVDSRPSDAIALALRVSAPIFVAEDVVQRAQKVEGAPEASAEPDAPAAKGEDEAKVKEWLESIKPGDFIDRGKDPKRPDE